MITKSQRNEAEPVISISNLIKDCGSVRAIDGLDLQVDRGEVRGF